MGQRKAVTKVTATRYRSASKGAKAKILDELCELTGWHRWTRKRDGGAAHGLVRDGRPSRQANGAVPARDRAPAAACEELDLDDARATKWCSMSAATIDQRLARKRERLQLRVPFGLNKEPAASRQFR